MRVATPVAMILSFTLSSCSTLPMAELGRSSSEIKSLVAGSGEKSAVAKAETSLDKASIDASNTLALAKASEDLKKASEDLKKVSDDFNDALAVCRTEAINLKNKISRTSKVELSVVTVGIVAGAIIVPALAAKAAAKSAIAAWGGVSGAANGYQYAASREGLSAAEYATALSVMSAKMAIAMNDYYNAGDHVTPSRIAVGKLILACEFPSPNEIAAAMPQRAPDAPKGATFEAGGANNGIIRISPADKDGGANVTDYIASIAPGGPVLSPADFRDNAQPTISVTSLTPGQNYQVLIRAQNRIGTSGGIVLLIP